MNLDIDGWLRRIGLTQYAEIFRANDIDGELLGRLTNDNLKDLGVASFGHRKKLLEAIAGAWPAPVRSSPLMPVSAVSRRLRDTAERRQVTVMFSGPGRVHGTLRAHGPRGPARGHCGLSEMRRRERCAAFGELSSAA